MPEKLWAVIVADVVGSSRTRGLRSVLGARLRLVTSAHLREGRIRLPYAVTAGDEFQTVASDLRQIPELIFDLRRRMQRLIDKDITLRVQRADGSTPEIRVGKAYASAIGVRMTMGQIVALRENSPAVTARALKGISVKGPHHVQR